MVPHLTVTVLVVGLALVAAQGEVESAASSSPGYNRSPSRAILFPRVSQPIYRIPRPKPNPTMIRPLEPIAPVQPVPEVNAKDNEPQQPTIIEPTTSVPLTEVPVQTAQVPNFNRLVPRRPVFSVRPTSMPKEDLNSATVQPEMPPSTVGNNFGPRRPIFSARPVPKPTSFGVISTPSPISPPATEVTYTMPESPSVIPSKDIPNQRRPGFFARPVPRPISFGVMQTPQPAPPQETSISALNEPIPPSVPAPLEVSATEVTSTMPESPSVIPSKDIPNQRRTGFFARPVPRPISFGVMQTPQPAPPQETSISAMKEPIPPSVPAPLEVPEATPVTVDVQPEGTTVGTELGYANDAIKATNNEKPELTTAIVAVPEITTITPTVKPEDTSFAFVNPNPPIRGGFRSPRPLFSAPPPSKPAVTVPAESIPISSAPVAQDPAVEDPRPDISSIRSGYVIPNQQKPYTPSKIIYFPKPIPNRPPPGAPTGPVANVPLGPRPSTKPKEIPVSTVPNPVLVNYRCSAEYGYFAKSDCDSYIECKKNVATEYTCPDGLHFNPNAIYPEYACAYPSEVKCQGNSFEQAPKPTSECPRQYGFFEAPSDCSRYISCQEGAATLMNCPPGLVFNPTVSSCDWPEQVPSCDAKVFRGFTCPEAPLDEFGNPWDIIMNYKYANSCKNYVACQRGKPRLLSCDSGFSFDSEAGYCVESDYVKGCTENY